MKSRILYMPFGNSKKRRQGKKIIPPVMVCATVLLMASVAFFVLRLPSVQISVIAISGLETIDERAVRERIVYGITGSRLLFLPRSSFLLADTAALAEDLRAAFPAIAEARIEKVFPRSLAVAVTERTFWGIACNTLQETAPRQCVSLDTTGYAYADAPRPQGNLIVVVETDHAKLQAGRQQIERLLMEQMSALRGGIRQAIGLEVLRFELKERVPDEIRVRTADGFMIYFRRDDDFADVFRVLKKVLDAEIGDRRAALDYIDARFGNKVFYKLR